MPNYRVWGSVPVFTVIEAESRCKALLAATEENDWELCDEDSLAPYHDYFYDVREDEHVDEDLSAEEQAQLHEYDRALSYTVARALEDVLAASEKTGASSWDVLSHLIFKLQCRRGEILLKEAE